MKTKQLSPKPTVITAPSAPQIFRRALVLTFGFQLVGYVLFWLLGIDRATHSFNAFGDAYAWLYYPGTVAIWFSAWLFVTHSFRLAAFGLLFGPLIGMAAYSLVLAFGTMIWFSIKRWNELAAAYSGPATPTGHE
jgi:hypothetical protein